jgi:mannose-6-phosphate isomerase-like protein (cupin superfamily)
MKTNIDRSLIRNPDNVYPDHPDIPNPIPLKTGTQYTFQKAGVTLAEHSHAPGQTHATLVLSGSITVTVDGVDRVLQAGDFVDLDTRPHSFTSLEPCVIMNIQHGGNQDKDAIKAITDKLAEVTAMVAALTNPG